MDRGHDCSGTTWAGVSTGRLSPDDRGEGDGDEDRDDEDEDDGRFSRWADDDDAIGARSLPLDTETHSLSHPVTHPPPPPVSQPASQPAHPSCPRIGSPRPGNRPGHDRSITVNHKVLDWISVLPNLNRPIPLLAGHSRAIAECGDVAADRSPPPSFTILHTFIESCRRLDWTGRWEGCSRTDRAGCWPPSRSTAPRSARAVRMGRTLFPFRFTRMSGRYRHSHGLPPSVFTTTTTSTTTGPSPRRSIAR